MIPRVKPITNKRLQQLVGARNTQSYREWKESILARDGYKCQYPNCDKTTNLQIHHIAKYSSSKHLRTELFNGITLCAEDHYRIKGREEAYAPMFFKIVKAIMDKAKKLEEDAKKDKSNS